MRILAVLAAGAATLVATATCVEPARSEVLASNACPRPAVPAKAAQWSAAQKALSGDFARIRAYLLDPTLANQSKMYARVDASLFQYYSYQGGVLGASKGKASGNFALTFAAGSQCFTATTGIVSFRVTVTARFKSTNRKTMIFSRPAAIQMKTPKIFRYIDPVTR